MSEMLVEYEVPMQDSRGEPAELVDLADPDSYDGVRDTPQYQRAKQERLDNT